MKPASRIGKKFQNPVETTVGGFRLMLKVLPLYLTSQEERVPRRPLGPFHTDADVYCRAPADGLRITWMGHSSLLLEMDGLNILIDPVWDERASPLSSIGPKRFFPAPLPLVQLPPIHVVLISHDHYDHLGKQTIRALANLPSAAHAAWVTSTGVGGILSGFGVPRARITELNWTQSVIPGGSGLTITALPARHFSGRKPWNRFETLWSSFALRNDRHNLYYGADSGFWDGFTEIGEQYGPFDLTMLEIGAYNELWKAIHMGPDGAAKVFPLLGTGGLLMPIHWGLFDLALHGWREPMERMTELADQHGFPLWNPTPGEPTEVIAGQEYRSNWWRAGSGLTS